MPPRGPPTAVAAPASGLTRARCAHAATPGRRTPRTAPSCVGRGRAELNRQTYLDPVRRTYADYRRRMQIGWIRRYPHVAVALDQGQAAMEGYRLSAQRIANGVASRLGWDGGSGPKCTLWVLSRLAKVVHLWPEPGRNYRARKRAGTSPGVTGRGMGASRRSAPCVVTVRCVRPDKAVAR